MEESKAVEYYNELTRKGEGAARFKQGLGFSSSSKEKDDNFPTRGSGLPSSSSFLSSFVKASSSSLEEAAHIDKEAQLQNIQNKLKKRSNFDDNPSRLSHSREKDRDRDIKRERDRDRDRKGERDRDSDRKGERDRDRDRKSEKDREREREIDRERRRRRSRDDGSDSDEGRRRRSRDDGSDSDEGRRRRRRERRNGGSRSPRERIRGEALDKGLKGGDNEKKGKVDYSRLIKGYDKMTPAQKVKAKMTLQLSETAEKDAINGTGWERFEFNKDAPLDDEDIEAVEDDAALVKHIGQSFRYSNVEARREEEVKAAHDEAMFGVPSIKPSLATSDDEPKPQNNSAVSKESVTVSSLVNEKLLAKQQGSWRDRVRKS